MATPNRFIDPAVLASLRNLPLIAKTVVDGFLLGAHANPRPGAGLEFNQYRGYQPGDDLRLLDWKMYARSERYYIREAEVESSVKVRFLIDASLSMTESFQTHPTPFDYARFLIASLAHLAHQQGDAVGLFHLADQSGQLPARHGQRHFFRLLQHLENLQPEGAWPQWDQIEALLGSTRHREILVVVSDLAQHSDEILHVLKKLAGAKHEIILFQIRNRESWELAWNGPQTLQDIETGQRLEISSPKKLRQTHHQAMQRRLQDLRAQLHDLHIQHRLLYTGQPLDVALRDWLNHRNRLG